ncbi:MAG: chemotaxis protein CheB [Ardenticatenales bacterium]|nr:chemotaxis protein CheB [Ardenticatenales bacterium]
MHFDLVVVGTSLGGLNALRLLLAALPATFPLPIAIVQHRHKESGGLLLAALQAVSHLPIVETEDKALIVPGQVYLAPADYHLLVELGHFALSTDEHVCHARPSIDVLFESAADVYGSRLIGVILTGASRDGAEGLATIKAQGGVAVVQSPNSAESRTMPEEALRRTAADQVLPLADIAPYLGTLCHVRANDGRTNRPHRP